MTDPAGDDRLIPGRVNGTGLQVRLAVTDPVRRRGLVAMLAGAGHALAGEVADVVLCDLLPGSTPPPEAEAPVLALTDGPAPDYLAGVLPRAVEPAQLDAALRAVAAGLLVRAPGVTPPTGFGAAEDTPPLTPREVEVLSLVGQGFTNKAVARRLGISVHTVKFHLEALFAKLDAASRAEAVAKGLRGGVIDV
ncbi:MAG TPA: response regulator transcription factor [Acetobacteraceae bacterium]|jgi:two-component system, NarL family, nitrate/nitrite response regulator NarL|nr:response regulator transcription factor [Acetobacteraceae bacterium]